MEYVLSAIASGLWLLGLILIFRYLTAVIIGIVADIWIPARAEAGKCLFVLGDIRRGADVDQAVKP